MLSVGHVQHLQGLCSCPPERGPSRRIVDDLKVSRFRSAEDARDALVDAMAKLEANPELGRS